MCVWGRGYDLSLFIGWSLGNYFIFLPGYQRRPKSKRDFFFFHDRTSLQERHKIRKKGEGHNNRTGIKRKRKKKKKKRWRVRYTTKTGLAYIAFFVSVLGVGSVAQCGDCGLFFLFCYIVLYVFLIYVIYNTYAPSRRRKVGERSHHMVCHQQLEFTHTTHCVNLPSWLNTSTNTHMYDRQQPK